MDTFAGCVASPHRLASEAGRAVLADGGNALDAAVATNLALGVVTPYHCGYGGDLLAMIWDGRRAHGYIGAGRAPRDASRDEVARRAGGEEMPVVGPLSVTVPGAVQGWFDLLERFGSRSFGDLAGEAIRLARDGFELGPTAAEYIERSRPLYAGQEEWTRIFGGLGAGDRLWQPDLVHTINALAEHGPEVYYRGEIARAISAEVRMGGGLLDEADLDAHRGDWVEPLSASYRGLRVLELPPPTQGATALEAMLIADGLGSLHERIEAMKLALADRDAVLTDPDAMSIPVERLLEPAHIEAKRAMIDPSRARMPLPGRRFGGGTAFMCAADADGMMVSLIQSNWLGFGSGVAVPGWGFVLHSRGNYFSLDPAHPNVIAPRKRTLHTLIPALAFRGDEPWLAFGAMGGDGQAQTHLQLLDHLLGGSSPAAAVDAPRWVVRTDDWSVIAEDRYPAGELEELRARGHRIVPTGPYDSVMGHAHVIARAPGGGWLAGADPRSEGAALGV